jgi:hypothetical protein
MGFAVLEGRCGVGSMKQGRLNTFSPQRLGETHERGVLAAGVFSIFISDREMGEDSLECQSFIGIDPAGDLEGIDGRCAHTMHP